MPLEVWGDPKDVLVVDLGTATNTHPRHITWKNERVLLETDCQAQVENALSDEHSKNKYVVIIILS